MGDFYVYDKAKYHMTGTKGGASSWEHASAPPLFFIRWVMDHDLLGPDFLNENALSIAEYRQGKLPLFQLFERERDMVFDSDMLSNEGNAFARSYFEYESGKFIDDLLSALGLSKKDYPLYTDEAYARFKPVIDARYASWKMGDIEAVQKLPEKPWVKRLKISAGILIVIAMFGLVYWFAWFLNWLFYPRN